MQTCAHFIPTTTVRHLGIIIDAELSMQSYSSTAVCRCLFCCYAPTTQHPAVSAIVCHSVYQTLVVASVLTKLDYGNATLAGLPANLLNQFESFINAAARSIAGLRRSQHNITDTLTSFH